MPNNEEHKLHTHHQSTGCRLHGKDAVVVQHVFFFVFFPNVVPLHLVERLRSQASFSPTNFASKVKLAFRLPLLFSVWP